MYSYLPSPCHIIIPLAEIYFNLDLLIESHFPHFSPIEQEVQNLISIVLKSDPHGTLTGGGREEEISQKGF